MSNYKYLAKNIGLLTISNFGRKVLAFLLIPLYTNILTTREYGVFDLFTTTVSLLIPILTLNIQESVIRFSLDHNKEDKKSIFKIAMRFFIYSNIIVIIGLAGNAIFNFSALLKDYQVYFFFFFAVTSLTEIVTSYARGLEMIADVSISSIFSTGVMIGLNIIFLVVFKWGLKGYLLANTFGMGMQCIYLLCRIKAWRYISHSINNIMLEKEMLSYSKPMILNSVAWWINNASDRYIVTWLCGTSSNGIYSVGYKIPSILNILQSIFNQAWTLSAVKEFDPDDKDGFYSKLYNIYNCLLVMVCSLIIFFDRLLAKFLYAKGFYSAWKYVPFLTIAIVFGALSGYIGGIFSAVKNSKIFAQSTMIGAICNLILNVILISQFGVIGAALATAIAFIIVWIIRMYHMKKIIKIRIYIYRDIISYILLFLQTIILLCIKDLRIIYALQTVILILLVYLYKREICRVLRKIDSVRGKVNENN